MIVRGDVVELGDALPRASLVTRDRVVCCYPTYEPMLVEAARHAEEGVALSYPRDRWFVRVTMWLENKRRARRTGFRTVLHPPAEIQRVIESAGSRG